MILFPCEACGKVICADDQSASQHLPCPYCQKMLTVPTESVVDCCLVYQDARHPGGQPMSSTELQEMLENGELRSSDLIWTKQVWRPLNQVLNLSLAGSQPQNDQPEIAVHFDELAPLPGFAPLAKPSRRKKRSVKGAAILSAASDDTPKTPLGERLKKVVFILVALGVLAFGVVRALRIYNYATSRFASVMLYNGTTDNIAFQLPFSGFDPVIVTTNSFVTRENLVVGLPCKKSLKIWLINGDPFAQDLTQLPPPNTKFSVPVRPCHDILVNYGHTAFPVFKNFTGLYDDDKLITTKLCQSTAQDIAANAVPVHARHLFDQAQGQLKNYFVKMIDAPYITDWEYNLSILNIPSGDRVAHKDAAGAANDQRPYVLLPNGFSHECPNGNFSIGSTGELQVLHARLPSETYHLPIPGVEFKASGTLTLIRASDNTLRLELTPIQPPPKALPTQYQGLWRYTEQESPNGTWTWGWTVSKGGQETIHVAPDGTVTTLK